MEVTIPDEAFLSLSGLKMRTLDELSFINPYLSFAVLIPLADDISKAIGRFNPEELPSQINSIVMSRRLSKEEGLNDCVGFLVSDILKTWEYSDAEEYLSGVYGSK